MWDLLRYYHIDDHHAELAVLTHFIVTWSMMTLVQANFMDF